MIVIAAEFNSCLTAVQCFDSGYVGKQPVAWKEYFAEYWLKELQKSMDRCTGCHNITEILLKMALNTIQSINQATNPSVYRVWPMIVFILSLVLVYCHLTFGMSMQ